MVHGASLLHCAKEWWRFWEQKLTFWSQDFMVGFLVSKIGYLWVPALERHQHHLLEQINGCAIAIETIDNQHGCSG